MPVFIIHSHQDKEFVDELGAALVNNRTRVWLDRWELNVGDSLIDRIQAAIMEASAIIIVLSRASVESQWCRKELSAGLIRELEERRVVVLPVLIEDCDMPVFLKDKVYADFRRTFDQGLRKTLEAIAKVNSDTLGSTDAGDHYVEWALDYGEDPQGYYLVNTIIDRSPEQRYSVLTELRITANEAATKRQRFYADNGFPEFGRLLIMTAFTELAVDEKLQLVLPDSRQQRVVRVFQDSKSPIRYDGTFSARRVGEDNGKTIVVDFAGYLETVLRALKSTMRPLTRNEFQKIASR
jgi:hypothetical protein